MEEKQLALNILCPTILVQVALRTMDIKLAMERKIIPLNNILRANTELYAFEIFTWLVYLYAVNRIHHAVTENN